MTTRETRAYLERLAGGPLTLGNFLESIRLGEEWSQVEMARRLGLSRQHLCDIEKGRRTVSPEKAAGFGRRLGYGEKQMVRLALQAMLDHGGLDLVVEVRSAQRVRRRKAG